MSLQPIEADLIRCRYLLESLKQMLYCAQEMEHEQKANCVHCAIFLSTDLDETLSAIEEKASVGPKSEGANEN